MGEIDNRSEQAGGVRVMVDTRRERAVDLDELGPDGSENEEIGRRPSKASQRQAHAMSCELCQRIKDDSVVCRHRAFVTLEDQATEVQTALGQSFRHVA